MDANLTKIILAIIAAIAAVGFTIKYISNRNVKNSRSGNSVKQKNISAGGDVGAGDINKGNINF